MTNLLVFREGEIYTRQAIQAQLDQIGKSSLIDQCLENLKDIRITKASLEINIDPERYDDRANDEYDGDPDHSENQAEKDAVFLTRDTRSGSIGFRHLVGAAALPCGVHIEVLPKVGGCDDDDRNSFRRMWEFASDLNLREHSEAGAQIAEYKLPLHEWLARKFLQQVQKLIARGIRSQYIEREENLPTVRGRLLVSQNLRANLFAPHRFLCRFEEFSNDRPENRLVRSAVLRILRHSNDPENQRLAALLNEHLHEIPESVNVPIDFSNWKNDRLMTNYRQLREPCRWIIQGLNPSPVSGEKSMYGRFVRMNDVFERYVTRWMDQKLIHSSQASPIRIFAQGHETSKLGQPSNIVLSRFNNGKTQTMRPDAMAIDTDKETCVGVLDAKWKKIDHYHNWKPAREDLYQMYAYATHWFTKEAEVMLPAQQEQKDRFIGLIFPATAPDNSKKIMSSTFIFSKHPDVQGAVFKFLLPTKSEQGWREGLIVSDELLLNFPFLKKLQADI